MRIQTGALLGALLSLSACDAQFSEGGLPYEFTCVDGATLRATVGADTFEAECVEVRVADGALSVDGFVGVQPPTGESRPYLLLSVAGTDPGTYPGGAVTSAYYSYGDADTGPTRSVAATAGGATLTERAGGRVRGTFELRGRVEQTDPATSTTVYGPEVTLAGSFDVPL